MFITDDWTDLLHCCVCRNPQNLRVDIDERFAYNIPFHCRNKWSESLSVDLDQYSTKITKKMSNLKWLFAFTIDMSRLQMWRIATVKIAKSSGSPDLIEVVLDHQVLDHPVLFRRLDRDQVHAPLAAQVSSVEPTHGVTLINGNGIKMDENGWKWDENGMKMRWKSDENGIEFHNQKQNSNKWDFWKKFSTYGFRGL